MQASPTAVKIFEDAFDCGHLDDGEEARLGTGLRGRIRAVALAGRVQPVDRTTHVVSLGDLDAVGEDLDGEGVVGNFLSICVQFCRGWKWSRSHPLCGVPWGRRTGQVGGWEDRKQAKTELGRQRVGQ